MGIDLMPNIVPFRVELSEDEKTYIVREIAALADSGWLTKGRYTEQFEECFAAKTGSKHCSALSSGTAALDAVLRAYELRGYEVLLPVNTNFGTAAAVIGAGAIPVFYDAGLFAHVDEIQKTMTTRTGAVIVVHIGGYISPEILAIRGFCGKRRVLLIEDASHAHFAEAAGVKAGNIGDAAAFSLFVTKVLSCGEGGVVTTNRKDIQERVNSYRDQGKNRSGTHTLAGNSWRMSEMNAIFGMAQLRNVESTVESLRRISSIYRETLATTGALLLPIQPAGWFSSGHKFVALVKDRQSRNRMNQLMADARIEMGRGVYERPLNVQPVFREYSKRPFPLANDFAARHVCFPIYRSMASNALERIIDAARKFAAQEQPFRWKACQDFLPPGERRSGAMTRGPESRH